MTREFYWSSAALKVTIALSWFGFAIALWMALP